MIPGSHAGDIYCLPFGCSGFARYSYKPVGDSRKALEQLALALALIRNVQNHAAYQEEVIAPVGSDRSFPHGREMVIRSRP